MTTTSKKFLSTSALSRALKIPAKNLFNLLQEKGFIERKNDSWELTKLGRDAGGIVKKHPTHGIYIAWDEVKINDTLFNQTQNKSLLSSTVLSKHYGISKFRINPILSEIGLIEKSVKGWKLTKLGTSLGGVQLEHDKTGVPYVCWPEEILKNKRLNETMNELQGQETPPSSDETNKSEDDSVGFRNKFKAEHRTADGHYVRSRAEMLIDNWLNMSEIVHAYERKLPIEEDVYCDFYLPVGKVYIEYWGLENESKYAQRKQEKLRIYEKYGFNLIELQDKDIQNLDDILPKKLLRFGIQAY